MNQEDIDDALWEYFPTWPPEMSDVIAFTLQMVEREREECADIADEVFASCVACLEPGLAAVQVAKEIRARGSK